MSPLAEESSAAGLRVRGGVLEEIPETTPSSRSRAPLAATTTSITWDRCVLDEESFHRAIALERRRTERSRKPFLLMLLDIGECLPESGREEISSEVLGLLSLATRETDVSGWYESHVVGVMFTEITLEDRGAILQVMMDRVADSLRDNLSREQFQKIRMTVHLFPDEWKQELPHSPCDTKL